MLGRILENVVALGSTFRSHDTRFPLRHNGIRASQATSQQHDIKKFTRTYVEVPCRCGTYLEAVVKGRRTVHLG